MRLRNIPGADEYINDSPYVINDAKSLKGHWQSDLFLNNNPLHIEIGMGKGQFITTLAEKTPEINYIGIERYSSVLYKAVLRFEKAPMDNLRFLCEDARELTEIFDENEINKIYLNFSDPWPKDRHAKRRLTAPGFLEIYHEIISPEGLLEFKTDNTNLFDYSLSTINDSPLWEMCNYTYDLHNEPTLNEGNIMTEYEAKFSKLGNPIHKLIAKPI
ncbi:MAG: tRNA (guanosine(46)-N7)-methyltransferase TrmB [Lachnospiraceae bacterium]|nr:tRNA (guanosine(46)-N7)-methyltransferase TrmB [Lachnospiraceae bacterium]